MKSLNNVLPTFSLNIKYIYKSSQTSIQRNINQYPTKYQPVSNELPTSIQRLYNVSTTSIKVLRHLYNGGLM